MVLNYALKRMQKSFFQKITQTSKRLIKLNRFAMSATLLWPAWTMRSKTHGLKVSGEQQLQMREKLLGQGDVAMSEEKPSFNHDYSNALDIRGEPTHVCPCGSMLWNIQAMFDDYEISMYFTDMECSLCGTKATAPTPVDKPGYEREEDEY